LGDRSSTAHGLTNQAGLIPVVKYLDRIGFEKTVKRKVANQHLRGFAFLDKFFKYFKFSYQVSPDSYNNIPSEGRLVIVANHPIGTLDGLALVKLIRTVLQSITTVAHPSVYHVLPYYVASNPCSNLVVALSCTGNLLGDQLSY
jgi:1-acyl-sn-glycerol-3-phosphate acyltransferase